MPRKPAPSNDLSQILARLDQHDATLADHETRIGQVEMMLPMIITAQTTALLNYLVLDSLHADYANVIAAIPKIFGTQDAAHDTDIKVVTCDIAISRTGALAPVNRSNFGIGVFKDEYINHADYLLRGRALLGSEPTGRSVEYVRNQQGGSPTASNYGAGDGKTYGDAYNGPQDSAINGGTNEDHQEGVTYYYCGEIFHEKLTLTNFSDNGRIDFERAGNTGVANAIRLRMDHPLDPGLHIKGWWRNAGQLSWAAYGLNGVYVQGDHNPDSGNQDLGLPGYLYVSGNDPTWSTTQLMARAVLEKKANLSDLESTAETCFIPGDGDPANEAFSQVWQYDDSGTSYVDETTDANSAGAGDWAFFPAGAGVDDAIYVAFSDIFSVVDFDVGTVGVGTYGITWQYPTAQDVWSNLADVIDDTGDLKNTGSNLLRFNPPADWVQTTENSAGPYYYIRGVRDAGTVTTDPIGDTGGIRQAAVFVRLYDDSDPGLRAVFAEAWGHHWGWNDDLTGTRVGEVELINCSVLGCGSVQDSLTPGSTVGGMEGDLPKILCFKGGRYLNGDSWYQNGQIDELHFGASTDGTILYDTADRPAKTSEGIQEIITRWSSVTSKFDDIPRWCELAYQTNGPYNTNSVGSPTTAGDPALWNIDGLFIRDTGVDFKGVTRSADGDQHCLAIRGAGDFTTASVWQRFYLLRGNSFINLYSPADGDASGNRHPVLGSSNDFENLTIQDFVIDTWNGETNNAGLNGVTPNGDSDDVLYDNGTGVKAITVRRGAIIDLDDGSDTSGPWTSPDAGLGHAVNGSWDQSTVSITQISAIRCAHGIRGDRSGKIEACYTVREDNGTSFTDTTTDTMDDGSPTSTDMYPATPANNDAFYVGRKRDSFRRVEFTLPTVAVGSHTLAFEYWNGSSWAAVSNLSDGTSGLTVAGTVTWDRPADWATTDDSGNLPGAYYWLRIRITGGTMTTVPQTDRVRTVQTGYWMVFRDFYMEDIRHYWLATRSGTYSTGSHTIDVDDFTGKLLSGETIAAKIMFRFGSAGGEETLNTFKARTKTRTDTDAWAAGVFLPNVSETPGVDIEEVA